jgi:hypothetical protein
MQIPGCQVENLFDTQISICISTACLRRIDITFDEGVLKKPAVQAGLRAQYRLRESNQQSSIAKTLLLLSSQHFI